MHADLVTFFLKLCYDIQYTFIRYKEAINYV